MDAHNIAACVIDLAVAKKAFGSRSRGHLRAFEPLNILIESKGPKMPIWSIGLSRSFSLGKNMRPACANRHPFRVHVPQCRVSGAERSCQVEAAIVSDESSNTARVDARASQSPAEVNERLP